MRYWRGWLFLCAMAAILCGCRSDRPRLMKPPGTIEQQRLDATIFDRYPDVDSGPPVVGGRPRGYENPLSESERSRLFRSRWIPF